jgi:hypothetical protein
MDAETKLRRLRRSTKAPQSGDIFFFSILDREYFLGMVVDADSNIPIPFIKGSNLIYLYKTCLKTKEISWHAIRPNNLLIPPLWTNKKPWTSGIFETIGHKEIAKIDLVDRYCFRTINPATGVQYCVNELGAKIECSDDCGGWGLVSHRGIDDRVSDALGIARVPEDGTKPN